jgi:hypothetical protein
MRRATVCIVLLLYGAATAADDVAAPVELTVKPMLCIVDNRTPVCDVRFLVVWQSVETGYYCVFTDIEERPLRCWAERRSGELQDDRQVQQDFSYWINEGEGEPPLASVTVTLLRMDSDDRRRRRRSRHVWDVL